MIGKKKVRETPISEKGLMIKDSIAPAPIFKEELDYMRIGQNYVRTFLVIEYPTKVTGSFLSKLYRFKGNLNISTHILPKSSELYIKQTENSIVELRTDLNAKRNVKMKPSRKRELENMLSAAEDTLDKLMSGQNKNILHIHMYLHLQAPTLEQLDRDSKRLSINCYQRGLRIAPADANMIEGFKAILPTCNNTLPEMTYRNFDTEAASSLFPWDESEMFQQSGNIKGRNLTTNSIILIDQKKQPSHNEFVVGQTGMGKSFYISIDQLRKLKDNDRIFVIDPEGELSKICENRGGQVVKLSPMSKDVINIMEIRYYADSADMTHNGDPEEAPEMPLLFQKIQRLKIFFSHIKKKMHIVEMAQLEKAIIETYATREIDFKTDFRDMKPEDFPILEDLYDVIGNETEYAHLQDFREVLYMYVHGSNARMFNGPTNVNLDNDYICFNLKELEEESDSQAAAMYSTLSFLWDEITAPSEQFTWLYIDEAHKMADPDNPQSMKFVYQIYKRIRKYKGGCTVATQQIADFLSAQEGYRNYGQAIIGSSYSQLILPLKEKDIADLKNHEVIKLSEAEEKIISKFRQGEGIYVVGNNRVHMKVEYTPAELKIISPKQYEKLYGDTDVRSVYA